MNKKSPAGGVSNLYARAGDYTVAQMQSVKTYGYGIYVCTFQPALGPVVSSFWLYSNQPAPAFLPDPAQNWRWNEIDFEWVPFTETSQSAYCELNGESLPPTLYGTSLDLDAPDAQTLGSGAVSWVQDKVQTDGTIARDMWDYYNVWMTSSNSGAPAGGTFTLTDASCSGGAGGDGCTTAPISWNASAIDVQNALDLLNGGTGLFGLKGGYSVAVPTPGGPGSIAANADTITGLSSGLVPQLAVGMAVTCTQTAAIPSGTTVTAVDVSGQSVTLSATATAAVNNQTFTFTSQGGQYDITFQSAPASGQYVSIDASGLQPYCLGKAVLGGSSITISLFQPAEAPPAGSQDPAWWYLLVNQTGTGLDWPTAQDWKYPLCTLPAPQGLDVSEMTALNFWRTPAGNQTAPLDFGNWGSFTHTGVLNEQPIDGSDNPDSFTATTLNNEIFVFDPTGAFNPYERFYTYVVVWTPQSMAQYFLPETEDLTQIPSLVVQSGPVVEYDLDQFPSLALSGPQAPGGDVPWMGSELEQPIGKVSINLANYVGFSQAGAGPDGSVSATGAVSGAQLSSVDTAQIFVGQQVSGAGISNGTTVQTVTVEVTLSQAATGATGDLTVSFELTGDVDGQQITGIDASDASQVYVGQTVVGQGIPAGTTVQAVDVAGGSATLSQAATTSGNGVSLTFSMSLTADVDGAQVTGITGVNTNQLYAGQSVSGSGIPAGTTIQAISSLVTLTQSATAGSNVSLTFTTPEASAGWSGPPPPSSFTGCNAYVRKVAFFPLLPDTPGTEGSHFITDAVQAGETGVAEPLLLVDFADGTWTAANFPSRISTYFGLLYSQGYTNQGAVPNQNPLRDAQSPLNVSWVEAGDGRGAMQLTCQPSVADPQRNFFRFAVSAPAGSPPVSADNPLVWAEITADCGYAASSFATTPTCLYAPAAGNTVQATVNAYSSSTGYYPQGQTPTTPDATATLNLTTAAAGNVSWSVVEDAGGIMSPPSPEVPFLITVQPYSAWTLS